MVQRYLVPAIKRAFEIIQLLAKQDSGSSISEIHRVLHLPLSSAATIVYTLTDLGYLERDKETSRYRLSVKMFGIARHALDRVDLVAQCHGLLEELVRQSRLTGHLAVLRDTESMYIDRVRSDSLVQFSSYVGMRWPAHTSAVGKALLAFRPEPETERLLKEMTLKKITRYTITSKRVLEKQLRLFRRQGYAWELNEGELGMGCVAAPVFGLHHEIAAAISLTGTVHQITRAKIPALGALVRRYAQQMSARLGDKLNLSLASRKASRR
jgi:IclR family acetate operon transcriptional repressor